MKKLIFIVLILSACGGNEETVQPDTTVSEVPVTATVVEDTTTTSITVAPTSPLTTRVRIHPTTSTTTSTTTTTTIVPMSNFPSFPRICQAWHGAQNLQDLSELEKIAMHDLWFSTPWDFNLEWETSTEQPYKGLSTSLIDINADISLSAAREKKSLLLQLNPNIKTIVAVLYREGTFVMNEQDLNLWEFGHLPPDSPYWIRDINGIPVPGYGEDADKDGVIEVEEILSSLIDFRETEIIELIAQKALALSQSGIVDGIFLDWWNEHSLTAASYLDWSTFYMTAEEEIEARLMMLRRIRELVGKDFLILVNTNERTAPLSAPYVNGMFMELSKPDYSKGYTIDQLKNIENSLSWGSENLLEPRINCLEGQRVVYDYGNEESQIVERNSDENLRWMRLFTTLALTHSDGYVLFGDDNSEPTKDHYHNWYSFWDADLGLPISMKRKVLNNIDGLFIREFTNGYVVYNRSGTSQIISLGNEFRAVSTGLIAVSHEVNNLDGEIYLSK